MCRCLCRLLFWALLVGATALSPGFAAEFGFKLELAQVVNRTPVDTDWQSFQLALGGESVESPLTFRDNSLGLQLSSDGVADDNAAWPDDETVASTDASGSEWDHLWHNAARIPVTIVPEPGTIPLLIGAALLCWARRTRQQR